MIDLKWIRENPEEVKDAVEKLQAEAPIDEILSLDIDRREIIAVLQQGLHLAEVEAIVLDHLLVVGLVGRLSPPDEHLVLRCDLIQQKPLIRVFPPWQGLSVGGCLSERHRSYGSRMEELFERKRSSK